MLVQILFIVGTTGLFVLLVTACVKFTRDPADTAALKTKLRSLQLKFVSAVFINPELERKEMETLQNKIKTSSNPMRISGDNDLKQLFASNCNYIQSVMTDVNLPNMSSWIKFKELMISFGNFYFRA